MLLQLDRDGPRYAQITRALTEAIKTGVLSPGSRLPSSRRLAADLGCARNVVLLAYEQLILEGYLSTRRGGGTFVSRGLHSSGNCVARARRADRRLELSQAGERIHAAAMRARRIMPTRSGQRIDFMFGLCEPDRRTMIALRSSFAAALRDGAFGYAGPIGDERLRHAVADRLRAARGIVCSADQLVITSGAQQALDLCARLLLNPGDTVAVEDPGYASARATFEAAGAKVLHIPVDRDGIDVDALERRAKRRVRLVYVTPSHQFPTGAVLSVSRRYALLEWARRHRAYIIEDDYDGEYRYTGRPIPALAAMGPSGPVIYCGTLAKALFPGLRIGHLTLPEELIEPARHAKWLSDCGSPLLIQRAIATLMATGEYERHIRRMTRRYRERRDTLVEAMRRHFRSEAIVEGSRTSSGGVVAEAWTQPRRRSHRRLCAPECRRLSDCTARRYSAEVRGPAAGIWRRQRGRDR